MRRADRLAILRDAYGELEGYAADDAENGNEDSAERLYRLAAGLRRLAGDASIARAASAIAARKQPDELS